MASLMRAGLHLVAALLALSCGAGDGLSPPHRQPHHQVTPVSSHSALSERTEMTAQPYFGERGRRPEPAANPDDVVFWNRWADESIEPNAFLPLVDGSDIAEASSASRQYAYNVLKEEAELYRRPGRQHSLHVDPDRLLHRYDFEGLPILVYENPRYVTVRVAVTPEPGEAPEAFVRRITGMLLRNEIVTWYFFPTSAPDESLRFSTFEDYQLDKSQKQIGIAGGIVTGGLYFTFYRSDSRYQGIFPPALLNQRLRDLWAKHRPSPAGAP